VISATVPIKHLATSKDDIKKWISQFGVLTPDDENSATRLIDISYER